MRLRRVPSLLLLLLPALAHCQAADGKFTAPDVTLHYKAYGTGAPAIALSGGPGMDVDYIKLITDKLPGYRWVLLEQRGTGRSMPKHPGANTFTIARYVDDLELLRKELKLPKLKLLGNSWGGMLAMAYAAQYPSRVEWMVLADSGGPNLRFLNQFGASIMSKLTKEDQAEIQKWQTPEKIKADADLAASRALRATVPGYFFDRSKALEFQKLLPEKVVHYGIIAKVFADMAARKYDATPGLKKLKAPVLIIQGRQDAVGQDTAKAIHAAIPNSTLVFIENAGHMSWFEQPQEFYSGVRAFLKRNP